MKKENTPLLETPRLILRKFTRDDLQDLFLIYSDETVNTFLPWFPFQTMLEAEAFFCGELESEYKKEVAYRYAIVYKPEKRAVGYVSLCRIDEARACGDLGYGLRKEYWNRGIVTEAAGAVLARQTASLVGAVELGDPLAPADPEVSLRICYAQPGEELFAIARRYHVSPGQMLAANDLPDGTARLDEARRLLVPGV